MIRFQEHIAITAAEGQAIAAQRAARLTRPAPTAAQVAARMLELGMNGTAVTADTLFEHSDWTRAEIEAVKAEAADIARSRAVRQMA